MKSLFRVSLNVALMMTPMVGTGCVQTSRPMVYQQIIQSSDPRMNTARMQESRGNLAQAKERYLQLFRENPRNVEAAHRLAVISTQMNRFDDAEIYYRQAYAVTPNDAALLADMGYLELERKDFEKAEALLEQSVRINGNDSRAIQNLAIARAWRGKDESSLAAFRLVYSDEESERCLKAIQLARGDKPRDQKNSYSKSQATESGAANLNVIVQTNSLEVDNSPIYLPSPSPGPAPVAPRIQAKPIEELLRLPSLTLTAGLDATIEIPPPLPPIPVKPATIDLSMELVQTPDIGRQTSVPFEIPSAPVKYDDDKVSSIELISDTVVENIILPSPSPATEQSFREPIINEAAATVAMPLSRPGVLTYWHKTPDERAGFTDARHVKLKELEDWRATTDTQFGEDLKDGWSICLVTLLEENRLEIGLPQHVVEYESRYFRFSSVEAMKKFQQAPQNYTPVADGRDIVAIRNGQSRVRGSLNFAIRYRRQLYLFSTAENANAFRKEPERYVNVD